MTLLKTSQISPGSFIANPSSAQAKSSSSNLVSSFDSPQSNHFSLACIHSSNEWILDSRATDHIAYSLAYYKSYKAIALISVTLPNGVKISSHISGIVEFSEDLSLDDVLYILAFQFNLLYVIKLTNSSPCYFIFNKHIYFIQNLHTWRTINIDKVQNGLYVLPQPTNHTVFTTATPSFDLWHHRLGHPSNSKLQVLQKHLHGLSTINYK